MLILSVALGLNTDLENGMGAIHLCGSSSYCSSVGGPPSRHNMHCLSG